MPLVFVARHVEGLGMDTLFCRNEVWLLLHLVGLETADDQTGLPLMYVHDRWVAHVLLVGACWIPN